MKNERRKFSFYTKQEDVCLGEALMHFGLTFTGSKYPGLHHQIGEVHVVFVKNMAKLGINANRRTKRSLVDRIKVLHGQFRKGKLCVDEKESGSLMTRRYILFSKIFKGSGTPSVFRRPLRIQSLAQRSRRRPTRSVGRALLHSERDKVVDLPTDRMDFILREAGEGRIQKERHTNARRLLHTLSNIHKKNTEVMVRRALNDKEEQEVVQRERKWRRDMVKTLLKRSSSDDGLCADFLRTLEDISTNDAKLRMMREDIARERLENDRENIEWERSTFEEFMKRYLD